MFRYRRSFNATILLPYSIQPRSPASMPPSQSELIPLTVTTKGNLELGPVPVWMFIMERLSHFSLWRWLANTKVMKNVLLLLHILGFTRSVFCCFKISGFLWYWVALSRQNIYIQHIHCLHSSHLWGYCQHCIICRYLRVTKVSLGHPVTNEVL